MRLPKDLGRTPRDPLTATIVYVSLLVIVWPLFFLAWALRRTVGIATLAAVILMCLWVGASNVYALVQWVLLSTILGLVVWRLADRESYEVVAGWRVGGLRRKHLIYRRKWNATMRHHFLHIPIPHGRDKIPRMVKFEFTPYTDRILVKPARGQIGDWYAAAPDLAVAFNAAKCRVHKDLKRHDRFWLSFPQVDRLATPIAPPPISESVDLERVTVGLTEDGDPWTLRILGSHLLVAGQIGSGKSVLVWAILHGIAPAIRDGLVEVHAIDPKGGMELGPGRELFGGGYAQSDIEDMLRVIENVVARLDKRMAYCEKHGIRKHVPTPDEPLILLIVDEAAVLNLLAETSDAKKNIDRWQKLILTQGRAPGVVLVSCVQNPNKATMETRDLYPQRIQHRSLERLHADMTLGPGARERGAETETLDLPGKAFFVIDGETELQLGRSFYVSNEGIRTLVEHYAPRESPGAHLRRVLSGEVQGPARMDARQRAEAEAAKRLLLNGGA
ncbi:MAG TPA: FtsK/SpoIIIE domain-containing protein [Pseudonocardiaceae bacterium]|jgi:S-DNA-T family DNA segregation ATPase FtsK/SpoIIIE|nr:FtsK/SpoIIIE domain-containing protein [Pseudonocardiaceae bacterium]